MTNPIFKSNSATSADGTHINFYTIGNGPGLLIIHGTFRSASDYEQLALCLSGTFTVHIAERRGRGGSGPQGNNYSLKKEVEDMEVILNKTASAFIFGHSFGGAVALELSFNNYPIIKLAIYEPAISIDNSVPVHQLPSIYTALANENYEDAFVKIMTILTEGSLPENKLTEMAASLTQSPVWQQMCELLLTIPGEITAIHKADNAYINYKHIAADTLLLYGSNTQLSAINEIKILGEILPNNKIVEIKGAGHNGPDIDSPEEVANKLRSWLSV